MKKPSPNDHLSSMRLPRCARTDKCMAVNQSLLVKTVYLTGCLAILALAGHSARAQSLEPYPEFRANYEVRMNGVRIGESEFTLSRGEDGEYLYRQQSESKGIASWFGTNKSTNSSRWRYTGERIQVLEYISESTDDDPDDNVHLIFDWDRHQVENRTPEKSRITELPEGTLDKMVMQLALLLDLRNSKSEFEYHVAHQGRIKTYRFKLTGEDTTKLEYGTYTTLKLERMDDDKDKSLIWSAPTLNYFPVRFLKQKKSGIKIEMILRDIEWVE